MHGWKIGLTAALTFAPAIRLSAQVGMFPDSGPIAYRGGTWLAGLLARLGDHEAALGLLTCVRPIGPNFGRYLVHPAFDVLRADPRFQRLVIATAPPGVH